MQGSAHGAGGQRLALPIPAVHERPTAVGVPSGELWTGRLGLQPGRVHQHCHLG